mgnify:CR=1 FL=1
MDKIKLETKHVSIEFPGVKALDDIDFEVTTGEIRAVVGANGAGKSTLMKVLAGANPAYTGEVFLNNKKVEIRTPVDAKKLGIQIVYQEVDTALYPTLSVAENIVQNDMVMGKSGYIVNWSKAYKTGGGQPWTGSTSAVTRWMNMSWCRTCPWPRSRWCSLPRQSGQNAIS